MERLASLVRVLREPLFFVPAITSNQHAEYNPFDEKSQYNNDDFSH